MVLSFADRAADSPLIERVWRCSSDRGGVFSSIAASHWEMVVSRLPGGTTITVRGPETGASSATAPRDAEWLGIRFRIGTFMPQLPVRQLLDRQDVTLPQVDARSFWLDGAAWEYPSYENAEVFVGRLLRAGLIGRDPVVDAIVDGRAPALSTRSAQRHFVRATGLTHGAFRQIERARHATTLLVQGKSTADVVFEAGFFDQAHLSRSLRLLVGLTPGQIAAGEQQLSFLYKTTAS